MGTLAGAPHEHVRLGLSAMGHRGQSGQSSRQVDRAVGHKRGTKIQGCVPCLGAFIAKFVRQLANSSGLASPVYAHYQQHCWLGIQLQITALSADLQDSYNALLQPRPERNVGCKS